MRRTHAVVAVLTPFLLTLPACDNAGNARPAEGTLAAAPSPLLPDTLCADPSTPNQLCATIPHEVMVTLGGDYHGLDPKTQTHFDAFSWQSFVALNWPADGSGNPLPGTFADNPAAPRVWEGWTDAAVLFWGDGAAGPCLPQLRAGGGRKLLLQMAKNGQVVNPHATFDEAVGGPLLDRNLNFALFEKKVSPDEAGYIRDSSLVTVAGQQAIDTINFPAGSYASGMTGGSVGAMEVKAAWRILQPQSGDDTTRYYHREAVIHVPAENSPTGTPFCINATVGLVGIHIIHKTGRFPAWVWSTFEHVDNAPECLGEKNCTADPKVRYSFYNPACDTTCKLNTQLRGNQFLQDSSFIWNKTAPYGSRYAWGGRFGSQLGRTQALYVPTDSMNTYWRGQMGNSVWRNYRLIGSQWQAIVPGFPKSDTSSAPAILGNTTLESYIPDNSSCIGCHSFATTADDSVKSADFSFLLGMAGEKPSMMASPRFNRAGGSRPAAPAEYAPRQPAAPARPAPPAAAPGTRRR
ncbi:hypothetical protein [Longimicrobium terrae]|uniref:Cytochrome c family protein n=1 Tax=Longimicrobium terrae TaxID=1639882 RepID=A0A841H0C6_9BACT|nr:hypothetical protein [Longimicrobium terrae]MBB4636988.1 hypothetical protein [Longimicrobium terrae]MBB6071404.1 hypothetical protein [Longimicrobium terrae]NNC31381.1 hypothetical protein [Longimicrobium terrae]